MSDDLISRQTAIDNLISFLQLDEEYAWGVRECLNSLPSVQSEPRWVHVKTRPMTEEERQYYSELYGYDIEYEEAIMFDCKMPEDGQEI